MASRRGPSQRCRPSPQARTPRASPRPREGIGYTRSVRWLWVSLLAAGVANFVAFSPRSVLLPVIVRDELDAGATGLGLVFAGLGAGGLLAAALAGRQGAMRRRVLAIWGAWAASGLLVAAIGLSPSLAFAVAASAVGGFMLEYGNVLWVPLLQEHVPARLLGRVSAVDWLFSLSLTPLGIAAAGPLRERSASEPRWSAAARWPRLWVLRCCSCPACGTLTWRRRGTFGPEANPQT